MTAPKSLAAYADCEAHFEQALASERGIRIILDSRSQATTYRMKMNVFRDKLRKKSKGIYEPGHPAYGTSPYDHYQLKIDPENEACILVKPYSIEVKKVEKL